MTNPSAVEGSSAPASGATGAHESPMVGPDEPVPGMDEVDEAVALLAQYDAMVDDLLVGLERISLPRQ